MASTETATDLALSLNGYDEIAIAKFFNADWTELQDRPFTFLRALIFVAERRGGAKDAEAYKTAMTFTQTEAGAYFAEDPTGEEQPDAPETEVGKDDAPSQ